MGAAFEGGSNYWAKCNNFPVTRLGGVGSAHAGSTYSYDYEGVAAGEHTVTLEDVEGTDGPWTLDRAAIEQGIRLMAEKYQRHFADAMTENYDAMTGDVFLQLAVMGEIVFG